MKNQFILLILLCTLASCETMRPASRSGESSPQAGNARENTRKTQPSFIQDISTESPAPARSANTGSPLTKVGVTPTPYHAGTDDYDQLKFKYSILTNAPVEEMNNLRLLMFMDQWYGAPYKYGGTGRDGIDCSAFSSLLLTDVYNISQIPRMSADQYKATRRISKRDLKEGDLVFFHTLGKGHHVTHVGVYLCNNRFVHASVAGVQISDLGEGYYEHHYVGAGRFD